MAIVRERYDTVLLQILGHGPDRSELEALVQALSLGRNVVFAGHRDDAWAWLKSADVAALISHFEGSPNAALEAAACRRALLVSDIPPHREAFDEASAVFVNKDDPAGVAAGLIRLLADEALRSRQADAAWAKVKGMSIDDCAAKYLSLYDQILAHSSVPN
jgi:glycosyltransferase involved in cell wall biosynthesis